MDLKIDERISKLLDQLENPSLAAAEIEKVKEKIRFLQSMRSRDTE